MADQQQMTKTTLKDFIYATLGGLLAPGVAIFLIAMLVVGIQANFGESDAAPVADKIVRDRIQPFGQSLAVDPHAPKIERTGDQVYLAVCASCHDSGALGAPRHQEPGDWGKRLAQGYDTLLTHALNGLNSMPARGGDPELSDLEVARSVVYMTNQVGARFEAVLKKAPEPTAAELARGKLVYAANCAHCHDTGLTGAQKLDDVQAWRGLLQLGKDYLYDAAINGSFGGPARGGNVHLSDADTRFAVDYMVDAAQAAIAAAEVKTAGK